jgi:hypothetical protein
VAGERLLGFVLQAFIPLKGVETSRWGKSQVDSSDETSPFDLVIVAAVLANS